MVNRPEPLETLRLEAQALMAEHPPIWRHANKRVVFATSCPPGSVHRGFLECSRWNAMALPAQCDSDEVRTRLLTKAGFYDYAHVTGTAEATEWHVNFADQQLFVAYGSGLFAQDEMQVAEHPALGALKEALEARAFPTVTVEDGQPTPVLVMGVERRCRVATDRNPAEGRPQGLYGNAFARADETAVRRATTRIDPPTITNLIAMSAPPGGYGRYTIDEIERILVTAFTGIRAAIFESARSRGSGTPVMVHTGFWGCGAFGGNRVLMAALQILAARMAALDVLVFHTGDEGGEEALRAAQAVIDEELSDGAGNRTADVIERIAARGFAWGVSDGN